MFIKHKRASIMLTLVRWLKATSVRWLNVPTCALARKYLDRPNTLSSRAVHTFYSSTWKFPAYFWSGIWVKSSTIKNCNGEKIERKWTHSCSTWSIGKRLVSKTFWRMGLFTWVENIKSPHFHGDQLVKLLFGNNAFDEKKSVGRETYKRPNQQTKLLEEIFTPQVTQLTGNRFSNYAKCSQLQCEWTATCSCWTEETTENFPLNV